MANRSSFHRVSCCVAIAASLWLIGGCPSTPPEAGEEPVWRDAFDVGGGGVLSAVWGSGGSDVFIVGGKTAQGEVYHFDGAAWRKMLLPDVPLLVWVFGFGPDDVFAVGVDGVAIHYDGTTWTALETGTDVALWGVWGVSQDDLWVVGGDVGAGEPLILHYDGSAFVEFPIPPNDRSATALFKVWGIGSKVFAVGENGLILEFESGAWFQVPAGADADDDFVSLWGTSEDRIVAVGGRGTARIARYDGSTWTTQRFTGVPGLNAVYMSDAAEAVVGGTNGFMGSFDRSTGVLTEESARTNQCVHGAWGDGEGTFYAVGGRFAEPFTGLALVRTADESLVGLPAPTVTCVTDGDCSINERCVAATCAESDPCLSGGDCPTGQSCLAGVCTTTQCVSDAGCTSGMVCDGGTCVVDGQDTCQTEPDCALGDQCDDTVCVTAEGPDLQYLADFDGVTEPVAEGGNVPVERGLQGGLHTFVTLRTTGFDPDTTVSFEVGVVMVDDGSEAIATRTIDVFLTEIEAGVTEAADIFVRFDVFVPGELHRREAIITMTVTDAVDASVTASLVQNVVLFEIGLP